MAKAGTGQIDYAEDRAGKDLDDLYKKGRVPQVRERTLRTNLGKEISASRCKF